MGARQIEAAPRVEEVVFDEEALDPELAACIPQFLAERHQVVPVKHDENRLYLAMADPLDVVAIVCPSMTETDCWSWGGLGSIPVSRG